MFSDMNDNPPQLALSQGGFLRAYFFKKCVLAFYFSLRAFRRSQVALNLSKPNIAA